PFPPLSPPTLDAPSPDPAADLELTMPWTPDDELRREMARLEAGYPTAAAPAPAYAPLPGAYAPTDDVTRLRAQHEQMHKLIEEMKQIFEQASTQEEANAKAVDELKGQIADLERQVQEKDDQVVLLTGQIAELEQHIQDAPAAPPPPPTEDELAKLA